MKYPVFMYCARCGLIKNEKAEFENRIRESAEFDEISGRQRDSIIAQKEEMHKKELEEKVQEYQAARPHKECPVCHSSSISKISNVGKPVKVGAFGILGAGDFGKTWKCEACGCKF